MCGIAGFLHLDGRPAEADVVRAMCDVIRHRGPDAAGVMTDGPVALGMRRLSIIDVEGGDPPIRLPDRPFTIVYNGECYNFLDERRELESRGRRFVTRTDTETVLALFAEYGDDAVDRLRGMYAFAIWDGEERRLTLVRDRIGQKPLYLCRRDGTLLFGSEIKSILVGLARLGLARPGIDHEAVVAYAGYGYVPDPLSIFDGVEKVPPATIVTADDETFRTRRYWEVRPAPDEALDEAGHYERLEATLDEAVRLRLISDVPLGAYLSGGVDSSAIVGLMARSASSVKTFSIGFEDADFDELEHARIVARHLGTDHHEEIVRPDAGEIIEDVVRHFDEPFGDSSAIPTYYVSRMARRHVTVVLSGDGGDELFCGYPRYWAATGRAIDVLPGWLRRPVFGGLAAALPIGTFGKGILADLGMSADERYVHHLTVGASTWHQELFTRDFASRVDTTDPSEVFRRALDAAGTGDPVSRRMYADREIYLPGDIMTKVDRMSMMVSLEARSPLLDHRVVETAAAIPLRHLRDEREGKLLLKRLARSLVPASVIDRKKSGFSVPVARWFNEAWAERTDDLLLSRRARERGIFAPATVARLLRLHRTNRRDFSHLIWSMMMFELWCREYVDARAFAA